MTGPRRGKPLQPRTIAICDRFRALKQEGNDDKEIVGELATHYGVKRPLVWKALRSGKVVPPFRPNPDRVRMPSSDPSLESASRQRAAALRPMVEPPCPRCNVRADIGCKHQPPSGPPPIAIEENDGDNWQLDGLNGAEYLP
jgi:hypothetical protein